MKRQNDPARLCRIAVVWSCSGLMSQNIFRGVYRCANLLENVSMHHFDALAVPFKKSVLEPVVDWKPHGVIALCADLQKMNRLREQLPRVPFVMTNAIPTSIANTVVTGNIAAAVRAARDHFQAQGMRTVALFCGGHADVTAANTDCFRSVVPDAPVFAHEMGSAQKLHQEPSAVIRRLLGDWLNSLPKPAGVLTLDNCVGQFLVRICLQVGLRVPQDIQIIGVDDADDCLDCEPHLTSLQLPSERIGEAAMEVMMSYLRHQQPLPPSTIFVEGVIVVARGSTGPVAAGLSGVTNTLNLIEREGIKGLTAKHVTGLSHAKRSMFYEQFHTVTGTTPGKYLRQRRLEEACRMLKDTQTSITDIANACGYGSGGYFTECFQRLTGQSPRAYREQCRAQSAAVASAPVLTFATTRRTSTVREDA